MITISITAFVVWLALIFAIGLVLGAVIWTAFLCCWPIGPEIVKPKERKQFMSWLAFIAIPIVVVVAVYFGSPSQWKSDFQLIKNVFSHREN
jgi:hypothetical protein